MSAQSHQILAGNYFFSFTILIFNATLTNMGGYGVLCHILYWRDDIKNLSRQICWNTFSIPGTNLENRSVASSPPGNLGGWLTDKPLLSPSCCQITDRPCTWGMGCQHQLPWDMAWWCCRGNAGETGYFSSCEYTVFKGSWEAILPCYGQIEFCDLKWCRVVDHITIHNKRIRSSGIDFDEGWW